MNAVKLMLKEGRGLADSLNLGTKQFTGVTELLGNGLVHRDWILTPEIRDEVTRLESNFIFLGNPVGAHIRLTHSLNSYLKNLQRQHPSAVISQIGASIFQCFNAFFTNLSSYPMGRERAIAAYEIIDRELKISANEDVTCQKGCTACCHLERDITFDEADLLAYLINNKVQVDRQLLEKQIAMSGKNENTGHRSKPASRCIFLGTDNLCMIYEYRPNVCRKYSVTSPPKECGKKNGMVDQVALIAEEVVISAALSCRGNHYGLMSDMLSTALKTNAVNKQKPGKVNIIHIPDESSKKSAEFQYSPEKFDNGSHPRVDG